MKTPEYVNSNLTPREAFNFHGTLPPAMIEKIIDELEDATKHHIDIDELRDAVTMIEEHLPALCDDCKEASNEIRRALRIIDGELEG